MAEVSCHLTLPSHLYRHSELSGHKYAQNMTSQRVWDYSVGVFAGGYFPQRLVIAASSRRLTLPSCADGYVQHLAEGSDHKLHAFSSPGTSASAVGIPALHVSSPLCLSPSSHAL